MVISLNYTRYMAIQMIHRHPPSIPPELTETDTGGVLDGREVSMIIAVSILRVLDPYKEPTTSNIIINDNVACVYDRSRHG